MHIGIIGRPSCGKTTVFRALTGSGSADHPAPTGRKYGWSKCRTLDCKTLAVHVQSLAKSRQQW